ncbi:glycoside hydrolase family 28 protein [Sphaerobolus stellatus SS14]|uniref:galacturonan 1,4-alpha-galacturonidase n=1 Tax=Sphaerobolus stellatus (strain SS14) TaxID=990650 RepID=A0A0C9V6W0_SPHS4|nr:glycoside hydrolase family 28 protein [Sphaerobolus stellatus SS14]
MVRVLTALTSFVFASYALASSSLEVRTTQSAAPKDPFLVVIGNTCTVIPKGAGQDDAPTILEAFSRCGKNANIILNGYYVVGTLLKTIGLQNVNIQLSGTIQYTPNIAYWSPNSFFLTYQNATTFWLLGGQNLHMFGGGTIDGNGQVWWDTFASNNNAGTAGGSSTTFARPVPLTIFNSTNVLVENIHQIGSPFWNNFVIGSSFVEYRNINISSVSFSSAPAANSDGWDIYRSDHVTIRDSTINNDDDCVSFKPNSTNMLVSNLNCNGTHGISVGSLGQFAGETDIVQNVWVENVVMANAQNGARIKVFGGNPSPTSTAGGGTGFAKSSRHLHQFHAENVDNLILIDQCYMTAANVCAEFPSTLIISDVHYDHVFGTASKASKGVVVSLTCSDVCQDITAIDTQLTAPSFPNVTYVCSNIASMKQVCSFHKIFLLLLIG